MALLFTSVVSAAVEPITDEELREQRKSLSVLESYLRLKNGVVPSADPAFQQRIYREFNLAVGQARGANRAVGHRSSGGCRRFINVYNEMIGQLSYYYGELLRASIGSDLNELLKARIQVLQFFERTMFSWIVSGGEAGQSELDENFRESCQTQSREAWSNLIFNAHRRLETLNAAVIGVPSVLAVTDETGKLKDLSRSYGNAQSGKKVLFVVTEVLASIAIWEKSMSPALRLMVGVASITPTGRLIMATAIVVYVGNWVLFDRTVREHVSFLQAPPEINARNSISTWNGTLKLAKQVLDAPLDNPPLYLAYAELLSLMRKQAAAQFLLKHEELLVRVEQEFGSIENAVQNTKEVLREEFNRKNGRSSDDLGQPNNLGAAN
jgi:hypothetical protein